MAREQAAGLSPRTERDLGTASLDQVVTVLLAALCALLVFSGLSRPGASWAVALGGWWEKYVYTDDQTGQTLYYMPASFFLNPVNGSYDGWTSYLNLTYKF
jgi:hypothetical protein